MYKDIDDYTFLGSTIGHAYFSGLTFEELWGCISLAETREDFDTAVEITIKMKELTK
jgi:hypothetical protein